MKKLYKAHSFLYRRPLRSNNELDKADNWDEFKRIIQDNDVFKEQLLIANKKVYETLNKNNLEDKKDLGKKARNFNETIYNYWNRSCNRCTPFGLFSLVGLGEFSNSNDINLIGSEEDIVKGISIDFKWLVKYILLLEQKFLTNLKYTLNNAIYKLGERETLLYCIDEDNNEEASIASTDLFKLIKSCCKSSYVHYNQIIDLILKEYGEEYKNLAERYVKSLISNKILVSEIMISPLDKDPLKSVYNIISSIKGANDDIEFLEKVFEKIKKYESRDIGSGIEEFIDIENFMKEKLDIDKVLQVDLMDKSTIKLPMSSKNDIEEFASFLQHINNYPATNDLEIYKLRFLEKYGTDQLVSLTELLDPGIGLGAPENYKNPPNEYFEYMGEKSTLSTDAEISYLAMYEKALNENKSIQLEEYLNYVNDGSIYKKISPSLELYFKIFKAEQNSNILLSLTNIVGCNNAGSSFGRFANKFTEIDKKFKELIGYDNNQYEHDVVEVTLIPENKSEANVMRGVNHRNYELSLYCNTNNDINKVDLEKIYIGIDNNRFFALDIEKKQKLIFKKTNMYNVDLICNEIKFLLEISNDFIEWYRFPWLEAYNHMRYIPEIRYKNIVVSPKQWNLYIHEINNIESNDYNEIEKEILDHFKERGISTRILLSMADNEILFDLEKPTDLYIFTITIKRYFNQFGKGAIIKLFNANKELGFLQDCYGNSYSVEVVVPLIKDVRDVNKEEAIKSIPYKRIPNVIRKSFPFEKWLYLKIYMKKSRQDEFIVNEINNLVYLESKQAMLDYFYVRYEDPKPHLRLRIRGNSLDLTSLYFEKLTYLKDLIKQGVISDFSIETYDQEIERYGGQELFQHIQGLFIKDSKLSISLLEKVLSNSSSYSKEIILCGLNIFYLELFYYEFEELKNFFNILGISGVSKESSLKNKQNIFVTNILENKLYIEDDVIEIINSIKNNISEVVQLIDKKMNMVEKAKIVDSIIHMGSNRFYGIDRKKEVEAMEIAKVTMFKKYYLNRSKDGSDK